MKIKLRRQYYENRTGSIIAAGAVECVKESVGIKSYGKEDTVKETQEGCLSRPIRIKSELF